MFVFNCVFNQPALTVNPSMDELVSFGFVICSLAGKISKVVLSMQIAPDNIEEKTRELTDVILNEQ